MDFFNLKDLILISKTDLEILSKMGIISIIIFDHIEDLLFTK
jgi:hypothetical protein